VSEVRLWIRLSAGLLVSSGIGYAAYRRGSLSRSGVAGTIGVGTCIMGLGGWVWGGLLIGFFVSSSVLSHYGGAAKESVAARYAKGKRRDLWQVLANGGVGALLAVATLLSPDPLLWGAFAGAIAAVSADTWATELGVLARRQPRLITTWQRVEAGTSGGISLPGTAATLGGALSTGLLAVVLLAIDGIAGGGGNAALGAEGILGGALLVPCAVAGGVVGAFADSLLGATVQAMYTSTRRGETTERRIDPDGTPNVPLRGWPWVSNDVVNLTSSAVGALVGALVLTALR
jgi:uncharacterized protein (TIGR00297 family)